MPNKKPATADDDREPVGEGEIADMYPEDTLAAFYPKDIPPQMVSLLISKILTKKGDELIWRTGHLEHIANLFAGDPLTTERDYADDLAVARAYSADVWERLTSG